MKRISEWILMFGIVLYLVEAFAQNSRCDVQDDAVKHSTSYHNGFPRSTPEITLVFHIVYVDDSENIPDTRIYSQLEQLNRIFSLYDPGTNALIPDEFRKLGKTPGIRFCLANRDPSGNPSKGIIRKRSFNADIACKTEFDKKSIMHASLGGSDLWDPKKYLNVFVGKRSVCPKAEAIFPWKADADTDGIIIDPDFIGINPSNYPFHLGMTLVHEIGHYLGLLHLSVNSTVDDCSMDDGISDTPPQSENYFGCPAYPIQSCGQNSMFMNYMSLVQDDCMQLFTQGQVQRMMLTLINERDRLSSCNYSSDRSDHWRISHVPIHQGQWLLSSVDEKIWSGEICLFDLMGRMILCENFIEVIRVAFPQNPVSLSQGIYLVEYKNGNSQTFDKILYYQ